MPNFLLPEITNEITFEELVCDVLNCVYKTKSFSLFGRKGQAQNGIDIYSKSKEVAVQCALKIRRRDERKIRNELIKKVLADFQKTEKAKVRFSKYIFASTFCNDKWITEYCSLITLNSLPIVVEYWSWEIISNLILCNKHLLKKYYPDFFYSGLSIALIRISNECNYIPMENKHAYKFVSTPEKTDHPILDFSFINNSQDTIILSEIKIYNRHLNVALGGFFQEPVGWVKPFARFQIDPKLSTTLTKWTCVTYQLDDPIFMLPMKTLRFQVELLATIRSFFKLKFSFVFNTNTINSPDIYFNHPEEGCPDIPNDLINLLDANRENSIEKRIEGAN